MKSIKGVAQTDPIRRRRQKNHVYGSGKHGQELFESACKKRGIVFIPTWETSKFDYLIGDIRVEIKYTSGGPVSLSKNIGHFDVVVIAAKKSKRVTWFIIPEFVIRGQKGFNPFAKSYKDFIDTWFLLSVDI